MLNLIVTSITVNRHSKTSAPAPCASWFCGHVSILKPTRTCFTAAVARWWTMRTPTKLWTRPGQRTEMSCKPKPISSSAARSLRKSPTRPSKVGASRSLPNRKLFLLRYLVPVHWAALFCPQSWLTSRLDEWPPSGRTSWNWLNWSWNMPRYFLKTPMVKLA